MTTKMWKASIKLGSNGSQWVVVQADTYFKAKALLEAQYGVGSISMGPVPA